MLKVHKSFKFFVLVNSLIFNKYKNNGRFIINGDFSGKFYVYFTRSPYVDSSQQKSVFKVFFGEFISKCLTTHKQNFITKNRIVASGQYMRYRF